jgi:hypothetical protein
MSNYSSSTLSSSVPSESTSTPLSAHDRKKSISTASSTSRLLPFSLTQRLHDTLKIRSSNLSFLKNVHLSQSLYFHAIKVASHPKAFVANPDRGSKGRKRLSRASFTSFTSSLTTSTTSSIDHACRTKRWYSLGYGLGKLLLLDDAEDFARGVLALLTDFEQDTAEKKISVSMVGDS